jgi:hypothetical protein
LFTLLTLPAHESVFRDAGRARGARTAETPACLFVPSVDLEVRTMSLSTVRRGSAGRMIRAGAVGASVLAFALLASACTSSSDDNGGGGGSGISGSGAAGAADASPGVTADTIKIGYNIVDLGDLQERLGFKQANYGGKDGQTAQIQAIVNAINANGGVGGRRIEPVIKVYDGTQDSPETAEAFCNAFTQDDQVFAVVLDGGFQNNWRPCFAQRKTMVIDLSLIAQDQQEFEKYAPFLWSPTFPEYGGFLKTQLAALQQQGWFNGVTGVAIVGADTEVARRQITNTVTPFLATAAPGAPNQSFFVDSSNPGTLGAGSSAALAGAASANLNRVIVVGGARILPVMLNTSEAASLVGKAQFAISSYDSPLFLQDNPASIVSETLNGMVGFGVIPAGDIRDDPTIPFPDPANANQTLCKQIIDAAGATPPEGVRPNYKAGLQFCDGTLFLKAVLDKAPKDLTADRFRDAAWQVGTGYASSLTFGGNIASGKYAATSVGRQMAYDAQTCQNPTTQAPGCFLYRGGNVPFSN